MSHQMAEIGNLAIIRVTFRRPPTPEQVAADEPGDLATPSVVLVRLKSPGGTVTLPTFTVLSVGVIEFEFPITASGVYAYRAEGTGAVHAADEGELVVRPSRF